MTFALGFGATAGAFVYYLAWGDLLLALGAIFGIPIAAAKPHRALLANR